MDMVKSYERAKYLDQRCLFRNLLSAHTHRQTHRTDCSTSTTKVVGGMQLRLQNAATSDRSFVKTGVDFREV